MDTFSNRSVFISLHFQIDPLWIAYSNVCVFMIVSSFPCKQGVNRNDIVAFSNKNVSV